MAEQPRIRAATSDDAAAIAAIYAPYVTGSAASFEIEPPTAAAMAERIKRLIPTHPWIVAESDRVVGYAYAAPFHHRPAYAPSVEVSVYVADGARSGGIGGALLGALLRELDELGFANVLAGVALPNDASVRLFEKAGFEHVGTYRKIGHKLGAWHDVGWWQLRLSDSTARAPPRLNARAATIHGFRVNGG
ncbi:MAG: GNAT family N-acetyltransferase [Actinomycetota bacterium]